MAATHNIVKLDNHWIANTAGGWPAVIPGVTLPALVEERHPALSGFSDALPRSRSRLAIVAVAARRAKQS
jgi:hypothetical protein